MAVSYHPFQAPGSAQMGVADPQRRFSGQRTSRVLEVEDSGFPTGVGTGGYVQDERRRSTGVSPMGGNQERRASMGHSHGPDSRVRQIGGGLQPVGNTLMQIPRSRFPTSLPDTVGTSQGLEVPRVAAAPPQSVDHPMSEQLNRLAKGLANNTE